jgi:hypothetical protein
LILAIIRYTESRVKELYRQCHKYGLIEQTQVAVYARWMRQQAKGEGPTINIEQKKFYNTADPTSQPHLFTLFFKNPEVYKRQYLQIVIKMV